MLIHRYSVQVPGPSMRFAPIDAFSPTSRHSFSVANSLCSSDVCVTDHIANMSSHSMIMNPAVG